MNWRLVHGTLIIFCGPTVSAHQTGFAQKVILYHRYGFAARCEARLSLAVESLLGVWGYAPGPAFGPETLGQARTAGIARC